MGVDINYYIGTYIKVEKTEVIEIEKKEFGCENCKTSDSENFCSFCGNKNESYLKTVKKDKLSLNGFEEDINYVLIQVIEGILIPNERFNSITLRSYNDEGEYPIPKFSESSFKSKFKLELETLNKMGAIYEIHTGIVCYYD